MADTAVKQLELDLPGLDVRPGDPDGLDSFTVSGHSPSYFLVLVRQRRRQRCVEAGSVRVIDSFSFRSFHLQIFVFVVINLKQ